MSCAHEQFKARVSVTSPRDSKDDPDAGYRATISIRCGLCGLPFEFVGISPEPSVERPMVANRDQELQVPLKPMGEQPKKDESGGGLIQ